MIPRRGVGQRPASLSLPFRLSLSLPVSLLSLTFLLAPALQAQPRLEVTPPVFDLGRIPQKPDGYAFSFTLKNTGTQPLVIERVRAHCGCTTTELAEKQLAPGQETTLKGALTTTGFEGAISKTVGVESNDPKHPRMMLQITARLPFEKPGLRLYPKYLEFPVRRYTDHRDRKEYLRAYVQVQNCDEQGPVEIEKVVLPDGWHCVTELPVSLAAQAMTLLDFRRPLGQNTEFKALPFVVHTTHAVNRVLTGKMSYTKLREGPLARRSGLHLVPNYAKLEFPAQLYGDMLQVVAMVENRDREGATEILRVETPEGWYLTRPLPIRVKAGARVALSFQRFVDGEPEDVAGLPFAVHTDHARSALLKGTFRYRRPKARRPRAN